MMMMILNLGLMTFNIYTVLQISVRLYQISSQKKSFLGRPNVENSSELRPGSKIVGTILSDHNEQSKQTITGSRD